MVCELDFSVKKAEEVHGTRAGLMRILASSARYGSYFKSVMFKTSNQ